MEKNLEQVRTLVNELDTIAEQIKSLLDEEIEIDGELNGEDVDLLYQMECIQNDVTTYQEQKGYI
tara:strand:+ start:592 stop:786 length:195 start_codon:yes stop_codon:yes gene_type:complete